LRKKVLSVKNTFKLQSGVVVIAAASEMEGSGSSPDKVLGFFHSDIAATQSVSIFGRNKHLKKEKRVFDFNQAEAGS
jgi:hypothetical protein